MSFDANAIVAALSKAAGQTITTQAHAAARTHTFGLPSGGLHLPKPDALLQEAGKLGGDVGDYLPGELSTGALVLTRLDLTGLPGSAFPGTSGQHPHDLPVAELPLSSLTGTGAQRTTKDADNADVAVTVAGDPGVLPGDLPAMSFDGSADGLSFTPDWARRLSPFRGTHFTTDRLTTLLWVRPTAVGGYRTILSNLDDNDRATAGWLLMLYPDGMVVLGVVVGPRMHIVRSARKLVANAWVQVGVVWDTNRPRLFLDGVEEPRLNTASLSHNAGQPEKLVATGGPLHLGFNGTDGHFAGQLADLRIYHTRMDATQIDDSVPTAVEARAVEPQLEAAVVWKGTTWTLVPNLLSLSDPGATLVISPDWCAGMLFSELSFAGARFTVQVGFPDGRCELLQQDGTTLSVNKAFDALGFDTTGWPRMGIRQTDLIVDPRFSRLALHADIPTDLSVGPFQLRAVSFQLHFAAEPMSVIGWVAAAMRLTPSGSPPIDIQLRGSHVSKAAGWTLGGGVTFEGGKQLQVQALVNHLVKLTGASAPTLPSSIATVDLESVQFEVSTHDRFAVELKTAKTTATLLAAKVGGAWNLVVSDTLVIGSAVFTVTMARVNGNEVLSATWKEAKGGAVHLHDFFHHLHVPVPGTLPSALDLSLKEVDLRWDKDKGELIADAKTGSGDVVFFLGTKNTGEWQAVGGIVVQAATLRSVPGLSTVMDGLDLLGPGAALLALSTYDGQLEFPATPNYPRGSFPVLGAAWFSVKPGVLLGVQLDAKDSATKAKGSQEASHQQLGGMLGGLTKALPGSHHDDLLAVLEVADPPTLSTLTIGLGGHIHLVKSLYLSDALATLRIEPPAVSIQGNLLFTIEHHHLLARGSLTVSVDEMEGGFVVMARSTGDPPDEIPVPMGLKGVHLTEIGEEVAVVFEPPGIAFGLQGAVHIDGQGAATNRFAFIMEVEDDPAQVIPVPDPLLLSIFMPQLDVRTLFAAIFGTEGMQAVQHMAWTHSFGIENLWLYWCQEPVALPDGTMAQPGIGANGILKLHDWKMHALLDVSSGGSSGPKGIRAALQADPIDLGGVLKVTGDHTPAVKVLMEDVNGTWTPISTQGRVVKQNGRRVSTRTPIRGKAPTHPTALKTVIEAGGPQFQLQTQASPYVEGSAKVQLFDAKADLHIEVTDKGFAFDLAASVGSVGHIHFDARYKSATLMADVDAAIDIRVDIRVDLGFVKHDFVLDTGFDLWGDLRVTGSSFSLRLNGSFWFEGQRLDIPELHIDQRFDKLEQLADKVADHVKSEADQIFGKVFDYAKREWNHLKNDLHKIEQDLQPELGNIEKRAHATIHHIEQDADRFASNVMRGISQSLRDIESKARQVQQEVTGELDKVERQLKHLLGDVEADLHKVLSDIEHTLKTILNDARAIYNELKAEADRIRAAISKELGEISAEIQREVAAVEREAKEIVDAIEAWAEREYKRLEKLEQKGLNWAKHEWNDAKHWAAHAGSSIVHGGEAALHDIGL